MIDNKTLQEYLDNKLITKQKHPSLDLFIYNYTPECVFSKKWDKVTKTCRGLILDINNEIVARPFEKFFNYGEIEESLPNRTPKIYKKLDGSLIIVTWYNNDLIVSTRGSFVSEQSQIARKILLANYPLIEKIKSDEGFTYLFEYTSPSNRIVILYPEERLTLLAVIINWDGRECNLDYWRSFDFIKVVDEYKAEWSEDTIQQLLDLNLNNEEGFVLRWDNNFRVKVKFAEYFRLHKLITGLNEKTIWEFLRDGKDEDELIKQVPEEFEKWVQGIADNLYGNYNKIFDECLNILNENMLRELSRKDAAIIIIEKAKQYQSILFPMLDGKERLITENIWKLIKPKSNKYFKEIIVEDI